MSTGYDVIGDVHGCAGPLERLLRELGYRERDGAWRHPDRTAVFVGDLIDRGPQQVETVTLVRRMVDAGTALITMGNHEFNAIAWATPDPSNPGEFLRCHRGDKGPQHRNQHSAFLEQVGEGSPLHHELIEWFRALPMHLDLGALRVTHACWHDGSLEVLRAAERAGRLEDDFLHAAHDRSERGGSAEYRAVEVVLKGPEMSVPEPYVDKDDHVRHEARVRWWDVTATTLRALADIPGNATTIDGEPYPPLPDVPSDEAEPFRYRGDVPVVFGHYWRSIDRLLAEPLAVCVDLSAVRGGHLCAYRFEGEPVIDPAHLVSVAA